MDEIFILLLKIFEVKNKLVEKEKKEENYIFVIFLIYILELGMS